MEEEEYHKMVNLMEFLIDVEVDLGEEEREGFSVLANAMADYEELHYPLLIEVELDD